MPVPGEHGEAVRDRLDAIVSAARLAGLTAGGHRAIDYGQQVTVSDGGARLQVNVYGGKKGLRTVVGGAVGSELRSRVNQIVAEVDGAPQVDTAAPARTPAEAHRIHAATGFGPGPWIGSDESGKGDFFGPLVAAAVHVGSMEEAALRAVGVRDSKLLDDVTARRVAGEVRRSCAGRFVERVFDPQQYNELYGQYRDEGKNLNHLLADGHIAVIEPLIIPGEDAPTVVADQFADERLVRTRLQAALAHRGLSMPRLIQAHRAEANVAVAAASILARDRFLEWLDAASETYSIRLPKGGSNPAIIAAARRLRQQYGDDALGRVAKLHFATTRQVLRG